MLIAALGVVLAGRLTAQTLTTLYSFTGARDITHLTSLILSGNTLYGTEYNEGGSGYHTVFKVNTDGTGFTSLYNFTVAVTNASGVFTNSDGTYPTGLILSGNTLYGTAGGAGSSGNGTVFKVNTDGSAFTTLHSFSALSFDSATNSDGAKPKAGLVLSGNTLYGSAYQGGASGNGTVFRVNTDGTAFSTLHNFSNYSPAGLVLLGNTLYGATGGTVFSINIDGTGFKALYSSEGVAYGLILSGNSLYGTGQVNSGGFIDAWVFKYNIDSTNFTLLYDQRFRIYDSFGAQTEFLWGGSVLSGDTLYCWMWHKDPPSGFDHNPGTGSALLAIKTDGSGYATAYSCSLGGIQISGSCIGLMTGFAVSGDTLYGISCMQIGMGDGFGTTDDMIFRLSFQPQLTIAPFQSNVVLSWPTNYAGFDYTGYRLQSTTNLGSSAIWATNFLAPVVVNGQNTVTNPISATQQFFRLSQ